MSPRLLSHIVAAIIFVALPTPGGAGQAQDVGPPARGEYAIQRNLTDCAPAINACSFCPLFAKNLNEFRSTDFDACEPRLSERHPEFTRPVWDEIPLDLTLAEMIIMNLVRRPTGHGDPYWTGWLKASEPLRAAGKITLWRTQIDIDSDGAPETVLRLYAPVDIEYRQGQEHWMIEPHPCIYRHSFFYMLESPNTLTKEAFNIGALDIGDIIVRHSPAQPNQYYALGRIVIPVQAPDGQKVARDVKVYLLSTHGAGQLCTIHWIPKGHSVPLKRVP